MIPFTPVEQSRKNKRIFWTPLRKSIKLSNTGSSYKIVRLSFVLLQSYLTSRSSQFENSSSNIDPHHGIVFGTMASFSLQHLMWQGLIDMALALFWNHTFVFKTHEPAHRQQGDKSLISIYVYSLSSWKKVDLLFKLWSWSKNLLYYILFTQYMYVLHLSIDQTDQVWFFYIVYSLYKTGGYCRVSWKYLSGPC